MRKKNFFNNHSFIILSIIVLLIVSCSKSYRSKTDWEKEKETAQVNHIKKITTSKIEFLAGMQQQEQLYKVKFFNEEGFKIKEINYDKDGKVVCFLHYKYSPVGNLNLTTGLNPDNSLLFRETISYDDQSNRKDLYSYLPDGTYKYRNSALTDEKGRMIQLTWFWPDGLKATNKYVYDGEKKTEDVEYDPQSHLRYRWQYHYDRKGNLIQSVQFYPDNKINAKMSYQYHGNDLVGQINYSGESLQNKIIFEYDSKHLLIKKTEFSQSGSISSSFISRYEFN